MSNVKVFLSYNEDADGGQAAQKLHDELSKVHVDAVTARHAILPGTDWEQAIRTELESSAALVGVGTRGYSTRPWCQQEIGWALGRHVPILWIQYTGGESPAGFLARTQALVPPEPNQPELIAKEVVQWLANQETTHDPLVDSLLNALEASNSYQETRECAELLIMAGTLSEDKWSRVAHAATTNRQVGDAFEWVGEGRYRRKVAMLDWLKKRIGPLNA